MPRALSLLRSVANDTDANSAYNDVLFAIGNNHSGTLYPVASAAVHDILTIIAESLRVITSAYHQSGMGPLARPVRLAMDMPLLRRAARILACVAAIFTCQEALTLAVAPEGGIAEIVGREMPTSRVTGTRTQDEVI